MKIKVKLYDKSGEILHAEGEIEYDKIADAELVERNRNTYKYVEGSLNWSMPVHLREMKYVERDIPYLICEF